MSNVYVENGYENRADYLRHLSVEIGVPYSKVVFAANLLGPEEDFDGLVTLLEDHLDEEGE